jgi:hypothetical protein
MTKLFITESDVAYHRGFESGKAHKWNSTQDRIDDLEFINTVKNWTIGTLAITCVLLIIARYL